MKVYTVQPRDFLDHIDENGFIIPQEFDREMSVFYDNPNALGALDWIKDQYIKRIDLPLDRDFIWVWKDTYHLKYARKDNFTDFEKYSFFIFEVPAKYYKENILWSNFVSWHVPLNHRWDDSSDDVEDFEEIFNLPKHTGYGDVQGVTTRYNPFA